MRGVAALACLLTLGLMEPAFAEVCDKVAPDRKPGNDAIRMKDPGYVTGLVVFMPVGLAIVAICAPMRRWIGIGSLPVYLFLGGGYSAFLLMLSRDDADHDEVFRAAIIEGCVQAVTSSASLTWLALLTAFLVLLISTIVVVPPRTTQP